MVDAALGLSTVLAQASDTMDRVERAIADTGGG